MAHGDKDSRVGSGQVTSGSLRMPTVLIPCDCSCTWIVVRAGPGTAAISEAKYVNSLCAHARDHRAAVKPVPAAPWLQGWAAGAGD
jgi:hypothetical protein